MFTGVRVSPRVVRRASALLVVAVAGLMLATFRDYGMTSDEGVQHRYARRLLRWYSTLGADRSAVAEEDISVYGGLFEIVAESATLVSPLDVYDTRHLVNVAFGIVALLAARAMARRLAGEAAGLLAVAVLVLTPRFYGDCFNNPKDVPFAAMFALAAAAILRAADDGPVPGWRRALLAGAAIGLASGVRAAGIVLHGFSLVLWAGGLVLASGGPRRLRLPMKGAGTLAVRWLAATAVGWSVMVAFWPWAQMDPLRNPFRAFRTFSSFWNTMVLFYDGRYVLSGEVSRFYLPTWFALTLPELYAIALVCGLAFVGGRAMARERIAAMPLWKTAWVGALAVLPVTWVVLRRTPLYDALRHFLFVVPFLAVLASVAIVVFFRGRPRASPGAVVAALALAASGTATAADMIALHPYQYVYFNRAVAGGLRRAATRYETDYACLTYKEGIEWLRQTYSVRDCAERVRVAGNSILLQTSYYTHRTEDARRVLQPVLVGDDPNYVMATTRNGDHLTTPGRVAHVVEREGAPLLYVFLRKAPECRR